MKLTDSCAHSVLSVKAVMVTVYSVTASRPERIACVSVVSPTADVPFCQSMRYMKDHWSGVDGGSHSRSTLGGTRLDTMIFSGGPGQSMAQQRVECTIHVLTDLKFIPLLNFMPVLIIITIIMIAKVKKLSGQSNSPTHGSDGSDSSTLPVPSVIFPVLSMQ